jgi:hypothetical protein
MTEHINIKINNKRINRFLLPVKLHTGYIHTLSPDYSIITPINKSNFESYEKTIKIIQSKKDILTMKD